MTVTRCGNFHHFGDFSRGLAIVNKISKNLATFLAIFKFRQKVIFFTNRVLTKLGFNKVILGFKIGSLGHFSGDKLGNFLQYTGNFNLQRLGHTDSNSNFTIILGDNLLLEVFSTLE